MKPPDRRILTINGGSSSIKFALFAGDDPPKPVLQGGIERIGQPGATLRLKGLDPITMCPGQWRHLTIPQPRTS